MPSNHRCVLLGGTFFLQVAAQSAFPGIFSPLFFLEKYTNFCIFRTGERYSNSLDVPDSACILPALFSTLDFSPSLSHAGKFEDFKVLGALLELNIGGCKKIDCKNALEVLPTMPWAAQIQKLDLSFTDAEGTVGTFLL